jgi:hypothetical protein
VRTLVGYINGTKLDKNEVRVAWMRPLFELKGNLWEPVEDAEEEFPARGYVFWYDAQNLERGTPVLFRARENAVRREGGDDFVVDDARPLHEVIDLHQYGDCEGVRKALRAGIPGIPTGKLLVACEGGLVVGPVQLTPNIAGDTTLDHSSLAQIGCFKFTSNELLTFASESGPRAVVVKLGHPQALVDWDDDAPVVRRAIRHACESDISVQFSKLAIDEFADRLVRNGASGDNSLEQYRFRRLRSVAMSAEVFRAAHEEVVQFLLAHPLVVAELRTVREAEERRVRVETEGALRNAREEIALLERKKTELLDSNQEAAARLSESESKTARECANAEKKVQERLNAVLGSVPGLLADVSLLKPFLGRQVEASSAASVSCPAWKRGASLLATPTDLKRRLIGAFKSYGIAPATYQPIHAAFVGGLLPVLGGCRAVEALQAYAHAIAGGRCAVVQVTSTVADVQDVFGRVVDGRFVPEASGLIDIVRAAKSSSGFFVVVLEGINRGPTESYMLPMIRAAVQRSGEIPLFHPAAVPSTDAYHCEARIKWPENLLLAATVLEGPTTLPIAPALWADSAYVDVLAGPRDGVPGEPWDVSPELFLPGREKVDVEWVREVLSGAEEPAFRFQAGLQTVASDGFEMAVARSVIVPMAASIPDEAERDWVAKQAEVELKVSIDDLIAAARRRLT